jgi:predicted Zn-dependent protease
MFYPMRLFLLFITLILLDIHAISAAGLIRDSEIEESIELIVAPLKNASGLKNIKIYILSDQVPNAFTTGGDEIFINSGLITDFPDPDVLRGVIAHEMGHMIGHHVVRRQEVIDNYTKAAVSTTMLGLATALSGKTTEGMAIALGGTHVAERSIYAYTRTFESSADEFALKLLEKSGNSAIGMIKFFEQMQAFQKNGMSNPYEQTHPMNDERLSVMRDFQKQSKYKTSQNSSELIEKYRRSSAKLAAFTWDIDEISNYPHQTAEIKDYMQAIKSFRMGDSKDAIKYVDQLIANHPDDPYYHELKAQIFFEKGDKSALNEYSIASKIRPNDILIKLGSAIVLLTMDSANAKSLDKSYKDLDFVARHDPQNLLALYYLAIYYEKTGMIGKKYLNTAIISLKSGRKEEARKMAMAAMKILPKDSPDWYLAGDILAYTE